MGGRLEICTRQVAGRVARASGERTDQRAAQDASAGGYTLLKSGPLRG